VAYPYNPGQAPHGAVREKITGWGQHKPTRWDFSVQAAGNHHDRTIAGGKYFPAREKGAVSVAGHEKKKIIGAGTGKIGF
jgi:hypothetical protein